MVCFADAALDAEARRWTWLGIDKDTYSRTYSDATYKWLYSVDEVGFKYHGNSVMAALGLVGLRHLETDNAHRRQLAQWYDESLADAVGVEPVPTAAGCVPSRHLYQVLVDDRDHVILELNGRGIYPGVHYRDNTVYPMYAGPGGRCPRARRASERILSLPLHLQLSRADVLRVSDALVEVCRARH